MLPTARHRYDISSQESVLLARKDEEIGPPTRYMLRHNTASLMKNLMCYVRDIALQSAQFFDFKTYKLCLSKLKLGANSTKHMDSILRDGLSPTTVINALMFIL